MFLPVGAFSRQRLLFASLSSSAFLIYVDPEHGMSRLFTLTLSQMLAATLGLLAYLTFGPGYHSGGVEGHRRIHRRCGHRHSLAHQPVSSRL